MQKLTTIKLARVQYIPKTLEPGVLYVSEKFEAAVHLLCMRLRAKGQHSARSRRMVVRGFTEWTKP